MPGVELASEFIFTDGVWNQPPRISALPSLERLMETTIYQKVIPALPEHLSLHTYSPNEATEAVSRISQAAARYGKAYLGLAVKRTGEGNLKGNRKGNHKDNLEVKREGNIDSLALATPHEVVIITLKSGPAWNDKLLINLLAGPASGQNLTLVAFGMARIAIQLSSWALNSPVVGIDLSTSVEGEARSPSYLVSKLISGGQSTVEKWKVDALWETSCGTEASGEALCLRAWITAWCAISLLLYEDDLHPRGNS